MRLPIINGKPDNIDEPVAIDMIRYAIDNGVNYVDTAYPYHGSSALEGGMSEIAVGNALKDGYRDQTYLSTKLPSWLVQKREDLDYYLNKQLERLQTDRIDFYLLHGLNRPFWDNLVKCDVFEFLDSAIEDGRIGYAGFSFHDEYDVFEDIVNSYNWSFTQIQYNYMDQDFQAGKQGLDYSASKNMGTVIMEPLRGGCLTKNIPNDIQSIWNESHIHRTPAEWALRYIWNQPKVNVILSGMSTMEQVVENIKIAQDGKAQSLTDNELNLYIRVKESYNSKIHAGCTGCNYCMPCKMGVDIPLNLNLLNDVYIYKNLDKPLGNYTFLKAKRMSASFCSECGECLDKCTQNIPITKYLKEARETFEN